MSFFIPTAWATTTATQTQPSSATGSILMLVVFAAFIYFLLWRPQSKRIKQHREMISSLKENDEVVTSGGLVGKIRKIDEVFIRLMITENSEVTIQKSAISTILPKGTIK